MSLVTSFILYLIHVVASETLIRKQVCMCCYTCTFFSFCCYTFIFMSVEKHTGHKCDKLRRFCILYLQLSLRNILRRPKQRIQSFYLYSISLTTLRSSGLICLCRNKVYFCIEWLIAKDLDFAHIDLHKQFMKCRFQDKILYDCF